MDVVVVGTSLQGRRWKRKILRTLVVGASEVEEGEVVILRTKLWPPWSRGDQLVIPKSELMKVVRFEGMEGSGRSFAVILGIPWLRGWVGDEGTFKM